MRTPAGSPTRIALDEVHAWAPEDPFLYDVEVTLGEDRVTSYVGMRSFGVGPDDQGVPRLLLNGRPYFQAGVLDQGYWPDGLMTAPSDAALVHDIATMRRLGFTMLRKHVKVEPLRWYHHCDRLGMLDAQELRAARVVIDTTRHRPAIRCTSVEKTCMPAFEPGLGRTISSNVTSSGSTVTGRMPNPRPTAG